MEPFCPICGYFLDEAFQMGIICPCCGNEAGFDDDIEKMDIIKKNEEYYWSVLMELKACYENEQKIPKEISEYLNSTRYTREEAWGILRAKWIEGGFKWKWNDKNEKPYNWNREMAKKQLENINIFLD